MEQHALGVGRLKTAAVRVTYGTPRARGPTLPAKPSPPTPTKRRQPLSSEPSDSDDSDSDDSDSPSRPRAKKPLVQTTLPTRLTPSATRHPPVPPAKQPPSLPAERPARREQTFLDFGQKPNTPAPCAQCGMAYQRGRADDEQVHSAFHRSWLRAQRSRLAWGADLDTPDAHGICLVDARVAPRRTVLRALDIVNLANEHLGAVRLSLEDLGRRGRKVFLRVSQGRVEGCVLAESISSGLRLVGGSGVGRPVPAVCGISRVWVAPDARRRGVASGLVAAVCRGFVYGCPLDLGMLAFTQPTDDGRAFASRMFGRDDFLVYTED
ncbi:hypothetical protein GGI15_003396 [Coemansia interrupta]|uniref:Uncharacterized protein n=1 Tax=Coemansia interrupta TaxID=1126814 RepID=A0A9W8LHM9_9FUNG|nr:hypothetical protein GGI15_003396 [Coemansia interrupta]